MKKKGMQRIVAFVFVGLLSVSMTALAQKGERCGKKGGPGKALEALDLTDSQREQIQALHENFKQAHADEFEQMKSLRDQLREQRQNGDADGAEATRAEIKELKEGMKADHEALRSQVESILTDEQVAQLEEMHKDRRGKKKGRRGGGDSGERGTIQ